MAPDRARRCRRTRAWTLVAIGGTLVQFGGCASGLAPIGLSVLESVLLRDFFLRAFGP